LLGIMAGDRIYTSPVIDSGVLSLQGSLLYAVVQNVIGHLCGMCKWLLAVCDAVTMPFRADLLTTRALEAAVFSSRFQTLVDSRLLLYRLPGYTMGEAYDLI
jgi:hypothetical protein